jgi:hypothetical protein
MYKQGKVMLKALKVSRIPNSVTAVRCSKIVLSSGMPNLIKALIYETKEQEYIYLEKK